MGRGTGLTLHPVLQPSTETNFKGCALRPGKPFELPRAVSAITTIGRDLLTTHARVLGILAILAATCSTAHAKPAPPSPAAEGRVQIFVRIDGTVPNWSEMALSLGHIQVAGQDAARKHYNVRPFDGSSEPIIPRAAEGSPRFLAGGSVPAGRMIQITLNLAAALTPVSPNQGSRRRLPEPVLDNDQRLRLQGPVTVEAGGTVSLVVPIRLGVDAVIGRNGLVVMKPTLAAEEFTPGPENYVNGSEIVTRGPTTAFPELNLKLMRSKVLDPSTGAVRDLTLRTDNGGPASFSEVRGKNETLWREHHGSLNPGLVQKLTTMANSDLVLADVWLIVPGESTFLTDATTPALWDLGHTAWVAGRTAAAQPIVDAVSAALTSAGATVLRVELNPAVLHVRASRTVLETVASRLAQAVEIVETPPEPALLATHGALDLGQEPLWLVHLLLAGQGLRIGIAEPQACIQKDHEAFRNIVVEDPVAFPCSDFVGSSNGHSTQVASCAGAAVGPSGEIQLIGLFQGRMVTSDIGAISSDMLKRNPHLINLSFEISKSDRRMLDYAVYADRVFVANGSGNVHGNEDADKLPVFAFSYNSVCVGGYNHHNTHGPENYGDDTEAGRWLNEAATGREKPDVVGAYSGFFADQANLHGYTPSGGTSFSTPLIVGTAALLMANFPEELTSDPTLTRAVLMASASHAIPGNLPVPIIADGIDDHSGAGVPRGDRAKEILSDENFHSGFVDRAVDFNTDGDFTIPIQINSNPGDKVRVVLTYDQCQDAMTSIPDVMLTDLDMSVVETYVTGGTARTQVHANQSHVDNTEIVEFVSQPGQTAVRVKVRAQHWDPCTDGTQRTHLAIAWDVLTPGTVAKAASIDQNELLARMKTQAEVLNRLEFRSVTPNPFTTELRMAYEVPQAGAVRLRVFDLAGRLVAEPFAGSQKAGVHSTRWDATSRDGRRVAPGVYLVQLQMGPKSVLRRVVLTR